MLAHFSNVTPTATDLHEPLYQNLFEVTFSFPTILGLSPADEQTMMINARNIDLNLTQDMNTAEQYFKYSGRLFLATKKENSTIKDMKIKFNVNVDDRFSIRTWNYLKKWYDLGWNSQTGELHYKREMVGTIVAHIHDRQGVVVRRVEFRNVQLVGLKGMTFDWGEENIIDGEVSLMADYWIDQYFDIV
jgi:hypothetical protein